MNPPICLSVTAISFLLLTGCQERSSVAGCEPDGSPLVLSTGAGEWESAGLHSQLVELWRSGSENEALLVFPAAMAASPEGWLAVADFELDRVIVFSDDGQTLGTWPRDHQLTKPVAVTWDEQEQLHILDLGASALLVTDRQGALLRTHPISEAFLNETMRGGGLAWAGLLPGGTVFFQPLAEPSRDAEDPGQSRWTIWRQRAGSERVDTIADAPARLFGYTMIATLPVPTWPQLRAATGGSGVLAVGGEGGAYRVHLFSENGTPVRTVCREVDPLPLSAQERGEVEIERVAELLREVPAPSSPAPHGHFFLGTDNELWVQRDRPFTDGSDLLVSIHGNAGGLFDVFDPEGRYLGELRAPPGVRLRAAAGDRVWGIQKAAGDGTQVVAYQLVTR
jgi:hypothetical protein